MILKMFIHLIFDIDLIFASTFFSKINFLSEEKNRKNFSFLVFGHRIN